MSSTSPTKADRQPPSLPATSEPPQSVNDLPTTSHVIQNAPQHLRPKKSVACMNCPLAVWMLRGEALECYCRTLYIVVWETSKPGQILMCDAPEQAREAAQKDA